MAIHRAMMVSPIGRSCMACSSALLETLPLQMTVILVTGEELSGVVLGREFFPLALGAAGFAAVAVYLD